MVIEHNGIAVTMTTWYLLGALAALWLLTLPLLVRSREHWSDVMMSLLGLSWLAFGLGIIVRFLFLSVDADVFASPSVHLAELPSETVDLALLTAGLFWCTFTLGALAMRLLPVPGPVIGLFRRADYFTPASVVPAVVLCAACVVASHLPFTPGALVTPLSIVGTLWVVPATFVWARHLSGEPRPAWVLAAVFLPGAFRFVLSPYREQILVMVLVVFAAACFARRRFRLRVVVPLGLVLTLLSTVAVASYRDYLWDGTSPADTLWRTTLTEQGGDNPLMENLQRFHVFDSLLLTVDLVPDVFPFAERNLLLEGVTRGLVPRVLNAEKRRSDEALRFQTTFWSYYNDPTLDPEDATATIAPSMPGSLYEGGGHLYVALGGFLWALLLAAIDRIRSDHRTTAAAGIYVLCSVQALAGLERDYAMAMSTLLQTLLVFFALCAQVWLVDRRAGIAFNRHVATSP